MEKKSPLLSIVFITMNRKDQLIEAIKSCFAAILPTGTEFIIIDNNSSDGTSTEVKKLFVDNGNYKFIYKYMNENVGVGNGRGEGFNEAQGKYIYFMDDDAVIPEDMQQVFFIKSLEYLEKNSNVASITTRIKDIVLKCDRGIDQSKTKIDGKSIAFKYLGGSHFLRKNAFEKPLYFDIKYGGEEFAPSIIVQDRGFYNVYFDDLYIIHKPIINKWVSGTKSMEDVLIKGCAVEYATKRVLYPTIYMPILFLAYCVRATKYLGSKVAKKECNRLAHEIVLRNKHNKVKVSTVIKLYKEFGLTVF